MPTSSARPERLAHLAATLAERSATLDAQVGEVTAALGAYRSGCPDGPAIGAPEAAIHAVHRCRNLAGRLGRVAAAFTRADSGGGTTVATASDHILALSVAAHLAGVRLPDALRAPELHAVGRRAGTQLALAGTGEAAIMLAGWADTPPDAAYASGVIDGLGARGVEAVVGRIARAYGTQGWGRTRVEATMRGLTVLVAQAGRSLSAAPSYRLDLTVIHQLGRARAGREVLRQIVLGAHHLHPALTAALGAALLQPISGPPELTSASRMLVDRFDQRGLPPGLDLPVLRLLQADPRAAELWELGSPPGRSRLAQQLGRRSNPELAALAGIVHDLYVAPVLEHRAQPWRSPLAGQRPHGAARRTGEVLEALLAAVQEVAHPLPPVSRVLAGVVAAHPAFLDHHLAVGAYRSLEPDPAIGRWFEVLAQEPVAIDTALGALQARGRSSAAAFLARSAPGAGSADALRSSLEPIRDIGLLLVRGAATAGRTYSLMTSLAIQAVAGGLTVGGGRAAAAAGPAAPVIAMGIRVAADAGRDEAIDELAWSDAHLDRAPKRALDRSFVASTAAAMAEDPRWRAHLRDVHELAGLDVVRSDEDWRTFRSWMARQDPTVRDTLASLRP